MEYFVPAPGEGVIGSTWLINRLGGHDNVSVRHVRLAAGSGEIPLRRHGVDMAYYVLSGSLEITLGTDKIVAGPHTLVLVPTGAAHTHRNAGDTASAHLETFSPSPALDDVDLPAAAVRVDRVESLVRPVDQSKFSGDDGFASQQLAQRTSGWANIRLYVAQVQKGMHVPLHYHEFDQAYYILDGQLDVEIAGRMYEAKPNTLVILPAGIVHQNWNRQDRVERHIAFLAPEPVPGQRFDYELQVLPDRHTIK